MTSTTVGLLRSAWEDWDSLVSKVARADLRRLRAGTSSVGWTLAHVSNQLDGWINVRFLRIAAHHYLHLGEAAAELGRRGVAMPDLPGRMTETI